MASFKVELKKSASKEIRKLPKSVRQKVIAKIQRLANNPIPAWAEKIAGTEATYRLRQGDYRILYEVEGKRLIVLIIRVAHRREVYRNL